MAARDDSDKRRDELAAFRAWERQMDLARDEVLKAIAKMEERAALERAAQERRPRRWFVWR